jgi:hypothetical protein
MEFNADGVAVELISVVGSDVVEQLTITRARHATSTAHRAPNLFSARTILIVGITAFAPSIRCRADERYRWSTSQSSKRF